MKKSRFTKEEKNRAVFEFKKTRDFSKICEAYKIKKSTLYNWERELALGWHEPEDLVKSDLGKKCIKLANQNNKLIERIEKLEELLAKKF